MKITSFDIFDTCLVRTCGNPNYVLDLLAANLMPEAEESQRFDFVHERICGYGRAWGGYINNKIEDVTLHEIYSCCNFHELGLNYTVEQYVEKELEAEEAVLSPVVSVREKIDQLREEGHIIMFVSDMYLPAYFLKKLLEKYSFYKEGDKIYVSSDVRKLKGTGNLFRHIQKELNLRYKYWTHIGDNRHSDYDVPRKLGMKARHVVHEYTYYERMLQAKDHSSRSHPGHIMAGISRAIRLKHPKNIRIDFAANLIAPIFVPFVYSVMEDATKRGITDLYFLARDSKLFFEIAKEFKTTFPNLGIHYLYVSRNSLYLPALDDISYDSLMTLFTNGDWQGTRDILTRFHMEDYPVDESLKNTYGAANRLKKLLQDENFCKKLEQIRAEQRKNCFTYLHQEGVDNGKCAIVDLNGSRRCHRSLNHILTQNNKKEVFGYYLEVMGRQPGIGYKAYNFDERYSYLGNSYSVSPRYLFEQYYCVTTDDRTACYDMKNGFSIPVFEDDPQNTNFKQDVYAKNLMVCKEFSKVYCRLCKDFVHPECSEIAISVNTDFFNVPQKDYLKAIKGCKQSDSSVRSYSFLSNDSVIKILKHRHQYYWWYGELINASIIPEFWRMVLRYFRTSKR